MPSPNSGRQASTGSHVRHPYASTLNRNLLPPRVSALLVGWGSVGKLNEAPLQKFTNQATNRPVTRSTADDRLVTA